jgi:CTP synthase (UTP-ammonia lyase)
MHEPACSLAGQHLDIRISDEVLAGWYGSDRATERYYCRYGLNPAYRSRLEQVGLLVAGTDARTDEVRLMCLQHHPFFVISLFVPQTASTPDHPHPVIEAFAAAVTTHEHLRALPPPPPRSAGHDRTWPSSKRP